MPFVPKTFGEKAPEMPHLVLRTGESEGFAIQPGATLYIVEDPYNPSKCLPMILESVSRTKLVFRCACQRKGCTRKFPYKLEKMLGHHFNEADRIREVQSRPQPGPETSE